MCGIIGILLADEKRFVNQLLFDGLTVLQHRGQDAAGIVTSERRRLHLRKENGLVKDVFQRHHMIELRGNVGIGHCRYPTAGTSSCAEAQPLYTNYPYGICVSHNGNLTNTERLADVMRNQIGRHMNTDSDSELLLNVFAEALTKEMTAAREAVVTETATAAAAVTTTQGVGSSSSSHLTNGQTNASQQQQQSQQHQNTNGNGNGNGSGLPGASSNCAPSPSPSPLPRQQQEQERSHHNHAAATSADSEDNINNSNNHNKNNNNSNNNHSHDGSTPIQESIFRAIETVMTQCEGGYAGLYLINGIGLVGFRDPHGIRPMVFGSRPAPPPRRPPPDAPHDDDDASPVARPDRTLDYVMASESVAIDTLGFQLVRDIKAGEAIFVDMNTGRCHSRICHPAPSLAPCIFEYVYFARPDSIMDGISVYETRLKMGEKLADRIIRRHPHHDIDVVIPIPDTSRTSALQAAYRLGRPFREGFIKNRYIARTFIMPGQETRKKSVRLKLNTIKSEFAGRNVLLVDDSIVRGTTANEIVQMAREAGAQKVYFCIAAPPIRYPNIYGIDIPTRTELIAHERNEEEIGRLVGCDWMVYQELEDLEASVTECDGRPERIAQFETSCFSGKYVTGQKIGDRYFTTLQARRNYEAKEDANMNGGRSTSSTTTTTTTPMTSSLTSSPPQKNGRYHKGASTGSHRGSTSTSTRNGGSNGSNSSSSETTMPQQSHNGCESVNNDKRETFRRNASCESLTNHDT